MSKRLVIIPTYKEKENIENIIRAVFDFIDVHILIIDDGSPDGTADIVKSLIPKFEGRLFIEERSGKLGLGTAYIHGFKWGVAHDYDFMFEMDADFSHDPHDLQRLYDTCVEQEADLAIGSRYCNGISVVNWPLGRLLMSYFGSIYVRTILGLPVNDTTAGFICYRSDVLKTINFDAINHTGYGFQIEMKYTAYKLGVKIVEGPIIFRDRTMGTSKMSGGIFREAIFGVIGLKIRSWSHKWQREIRKK